MQREGEAVGRVGRVCGEFAVVLEWNEGILELEWKHAMRDDL